MMGILIHILIAIIVADTFGRKTLGRWALLLGAGCSLLLDIPSLFLDPLDIFEQTHGANWSHSLFSITLYTLVCTGISFAQKKSPLHYLQVVIPVFVIHLFFDISTTNGITLFFPIWNTPIQMHGFSRFDPIIVTPLLIALVRTYKIPRTYWSKRVLIFLCSYSLFAHGISIQAKNSIAPMLTQMGFPSDKIHVTTPTYVFPLRRITVQDDAHRFAVAYVSPLTFRPPRIYVRERIWNPQISSLLSSAKGQRLLQVSSSMIFIERENNKYLFSDVRFGGLMEAWNSPLQLQSVLDKGNALPLEHVYVYSNTPLSEDIQQGWNLLLP